MRKPFKTRDGFSSASDNATQQVLCKTCKLAVLTLALGLPPNILFLSKGQAMQDPTCGRRSTPISSLEGAPKAGDGHANDLRLLQGELFDQPVQVVNVSSGESNGSDLLNGLHIHSVSQSDHHIVDAANKHNANDIQQQPENSLNVTEANVSSVSADTPSQSSVPLAVQVPSPLDWLLNPSKAAPRLGELGSSGRVEEIYDRILARLIQLEAHEGEASFRDDYRISWLIVRFCQTGEAKLCTPQVLATYRVLGCHPDQVWPRIVQRRFALLGRSTPLAIRPKAGAVPTPLPEQAAPVPLSQKKPAEVIPMKKEKQA